MEALHQVLALILFFQILHLQVVLQELVIQVVFLRHKLEDQVAVDQDQVRLIQLTQDQQEINHLQLQIKVMTEAVVKTLQMVHMETVDTAVAAEVQELQEKLGIKVLTVTAE